MTLDALLASIFLPTPEYGHLERTVVLSTVRTTVGRYVGRRQPGRQLRVDNPEIDHERDGDIERRCDRVDQDSG